LKVDANIVDGYLSSMRSGDSGCFESLYEYSYNLLYAYVLSLTGDGFTAEDVVQDTFVKIINGITKYKPGTNGLAWIIQIAKNTALNYDDKQKRIVVVEYEAKTKGPEDRIAETDYIKYILKKLSVKERQVFTMYLYGEYNFREIAENLGFSVSCAERRYKSAVKKLKIALEKDGVIYE